MVKLNEVYKCEVCGNIVEVTHASSGELVCCGKPMNLLEEKTNDEGNEKHVPIIERNGEKVLVKVGSVPHPMEEEHYIEWIELICESGIFKHYLKPGDEPTIIFNIGDWMDISVRIYCNLHGLWKNN